MAIIQKTTSHLTTIQLETQSVFTNLNKPDHYEYIDNASAKWNRNWSSQDLLGHFTDSCWRYQWNLLNHKYTFYHQWPQSFHRDLNINGCQVFPGLFSGYYEFHTIYYKSSSTIVCVCEVQGRFKEQQTCIYFVAFRFGHIPANTQCKFLTTT